MKDKKIAKQGKISYIFTRETFGMSLMLFSVIVLIMLLSHDTVFAGIGKAVCTFMYGTFGYGSILITLILAYLGEWLTFEKRLRISVKKVITISLTSFMAFLLFHAATTHNYQLTSYGNYITECYVNAQNGFAGYTFGGVVSAIFVYPVSTLGGFVTAYVLFSVLVLLCGYLTFLSFKGTSAFKIVSKKTAHREENTENGEEPVSEPVKQILSAPDDESSQIFRPRSEEKLQVKANRENTVVVSRTPLQPKATEERYSDKSLGNKIIFQKGEFAAESYRRNMIFNDNSYFASPAVSSEEDYLSSFTADRPLKAKAKSYSESYKEEVYSQPYGSMPSSYVYEEKPVEKLNPEAVHEDYYEPVRDEYVEPHIKPREEIRPEYNIQPEVNPYTVEEPEYNPIYKEEAEPIEAKAESEIRSFEREEIKEEIIRTERRVEEPVVPAVEDNGFIGFGERTSKSEISEEETNNSSEDYVADKPQVGRYDFVNASGRTDRSASRSERSNSELFDSDDADEEDTNPTENVFLRPRTERTAPIENMRPTVRRTEPEKPITSAASPVEEQPKEKPKHIWKKYVRPSLDLLDNYPENANVNTGEIEDNKRTIVETLSRFKIASNVANVTIGPAITRYDVIIEDKTNIKRALGYRDAIAMELRKDNVNAYLNYSKGALSIEVPNNKKSIVGLKNMLASSKFINSKAGSLTFALGKNIDGEVICPDITRMPHLLVAGTTGSGKSICLSALLVSLLYKYGPEELRLILVDPKQVEFISYDKLPHLMINEIIYDCDKAIKALNWAIKEMERRYSLFKDMSEAGTATKSLDEYNAHLPEGEEKLAKIVIVLDEFGDLMLQAKKDIESKIIKLVQKARACGIHLILATQRPSVDCITGLIKSNLPTRIGFKVNSFDDSRTIFDIGGAEKLLGKGDSYFRSAESPDLARIQCCFVDTHEVQKVTDFVKANNETYFDQGVSDFINTVEQEDAPANTLSSGSGDNDDGEAKIDDTYIQALKYCVTSNQASVSMIQRRFPVGYIKACKIIDWMENMNYITPSEGSKPRKVLLSKDEFINIYGEVDD